MDVDPSPLAVGSHGAAASFAEVTAPDDSS
jgi:hypothetical protein